MLAAPNRSRIRAVVQHAEKLPDSPAKWALRLRLESVEVLYGGAFIHEGEDVEGFAFDLPEPLALGAVLVAEAEYIGGARGGTLQLHEPRLAPR
jgi:hypothetical protein